GAHISALNEIDACEITALCDIDPDHLQNGVDQVKGPKPGTFRDYIKLLEQPNVDAVAIVTPNQLHKEMTIRALEARKHVLCEKPMGITMEDCDEVVAAAKKFRNLLQYGMQLRHTPTFIKVNELVQGGAIGNIRYAWISDFRRDIRELYEDRVVERTKNWRYFQDTSGGMLLEYSIHRLDLINWWMNSKPVMISAFGGHNVWMDRETIDHAGLLVEYANGAKATYGMALYSVGYRAPWLIIGDAGQMLVEAQSVTVQKGDVTNSIDSPRFEDSKEVIELPGGNGTKLQYDHFVKAIRGEAKPYPDWRIAYNAMMVGIQGESVIRDEKTLKL
ncbi:MAG TPA: Gfo/Idh/MocA family oxidoreductase, partial [Acidobacteriota bacterium]|nr:Gfo/Idh/MocA family oxidoreductase [Acidobacteriota bacterium]